MSALHVLHTFVYQLGRTHRDGPFGFFAVVEQGVHLVFYDGFVLLLFRQRILTKCKSKWQLFQMFFDETMYPNWWVCKLVPTLGDG